MSTTKAKKDLHEDQYHMMQFAGRGGWGDATAGNWSPPSGYPDLSDSKYLAVDLETRDPNLRKLGPGWTRKDGYVIGIAISNGDYSAYYPIRHEGGGNLPEKATLRWLTKQMATPNVPKVFHNALYDLGWLRAEGIEVQGRIIDTMIAAPLLDENRWSYSLNALGGHYLKEYKNERNMTAFAKQMGIDPKADMWRMPADVVGEYAEQDAALTLRLWQRLEAELRADECTAIFDLETSLIPTLFEMKTRGVRVDVDRADVVRKDLQNREEGLLKKVKDETGVLIEPWVATSIAKAFDAVGLSYPTTDNSNAPSFTKQFLTSHEHPLAQWIVKLREYNKANTTFIETILEHSHNGRIHCDFNQLRSDDGGTVTGRFSSSNPNLQQIPARDPEIKAMIRGLFLPEEGTKWGSFDYASQEPRWLAHYCASLENPHAAIEGVVKMYHEGDADFHQMVADLAGISRKEAKTVNLGIMYGMGRGKLATVMDLTDEEAKSLLAQYHDKVPFVKGIADRVSRHADRTGVIRTWLGRKCRFDMWEPKSYGYNKPLPAEEAAQEYGGKGMIRRAFTYKALNKLIQGSSADQTKKAMVDCANEGMLPMLTVHDELCFSVEDESQANKIVDIMSNCVPNLKVPFEVDAELGNNWGEVG